MGNKSSSPQNGQLPSATESSSPKVQTIPPIIETTPPQEQTDHDSPNSSMMLLGPFGIEPKHVLLLASLPLCIGAYSGYREQVAEAEKAAKRAARRKAAGAAPPRLTINARILGARALGVGTMMSCGGFAFLGAVSFYASGYRSFQQAFDSFHEWGQKNRAQLEAWHGVNLSKDHPDMIATKNMSEEEEWKYVQDKYLTDDKLAKKSPNQSGI